MKLKLENEDDDEDDEDFWKEILPNIIMFLLMISLAIFIGNFYKDYKESNIIENIHKNYNDKEYSLDKHIKDNITFPSYWKLKYDKTDETIQILQLVEDLYKEKYGNKEYEEIQRNLYIKLSEYKEKYLKSEY